MKNYILLKIMAAGAVLCGRKSGKLFHGFFGAVPHTFAAFYAQGVVYYRIALCILRYGADRAQTDEGTDVVVWADFFVYLYHSRNFFRKFSEWTVFCKTDFIYLYIDKTEQMQP